MKKQEEKESEIQKICLFRLEKFLCGLDIQKVHEICIKHHITEVYGAPSCVIGIANLRGNIVTIIDLRKRFNLTGSNDFNSPKILIIEYKGEKVGLLVDEVESVIEVDPTLFDRSMKKFSEINSEFYQGIYKLEDSLVALLNLEGILDFKNQEAKSAS